MLHARIVAFGFSALSRAFAFFCSDLIVECEVVPDAIAYLIKLG